VSEFESLNDLVRYEVHFKDTIDFGENNCVNYPAIIRLKMEIHANLLENLDIFKDNSIDLSVLINSTIWVWDSLEHEELIGLLLIHDKNLSCNDSQIVLILTLCHGDNLIWLSCVGLQE
jgi:hypothetical protein